MGLREIGTSQDIDFEGYGEILHVREVPATGKRAFDIDHDTGQIVDETYQAVPTPFVIERTGATPASSHSPSTTVPIRTGRRRFSIS